MHHISSIEYWDIDRTSGTSNAKVSLSWGTSSAVSDNAIDLLDLIVGHYHSGKWSREGDVALASGSDHNSGSITTTHYVSSFSPFTLASRTTNNTLPVGISDFELAKLDHAVQTSWKLEDPSKVEEIVLERSDDMVNFFPITSITATADQSLYSFIDQEIQSGKHQYRVKLSGNGIKVLSNVKEININYIEIHSVSISPNPCVHNIVLSAEESSKPSYYYLRSINGHILYQAQVASLKEIEVSVNSHLHQLKTGSYLLEIAFSDHREVLKLLTL